MKQSLLKTHDVRCAISQIIEVGVLCTSTQLPSDKSLVVRSEGPKFSPQLDHKCVLLTPERNN